MDEYVYMATTLPGLEAVLADEMKHAVHGAKICYIKRGKVFAAAVPNEDSLMRLRTADNVYRMLARFPAGLRRADLQRLERETASAPGLDLPGGQDLGGSVRFVVNASRRGDHRYSRFEAAEAAMRGVAKRHPQWRIGTPERHSHEFRLDLDGEEATFFLRLTGPEFRFRGSRSFVPGALRPTVAHGLVWLSRPRADDRFVDVCCGSGTIVSERLAYPCGELLAGDLSAEAIAAARANLPAGCPAQVRVWDATSLPLPSGFVTAVVSNLPFGRQIGSRDGLPSLYAGIVGEIARVLLPGGRAVLLAEDGAALREAAERCSLACGELARLSLKGLQPAVYRLSK